MNGATADGAELAIETQGLWKSFATPRRGGRGRHGDAQGGGAVVAAVRGIDLTVRAGEVFGFLGPNGAGKTTTVRMLATLLKSDDGSARVAGYDTRRQPDEVRRHIGYVSQSGGVNPSTRVRANLLLQARLFGLRAQRAEARADEMLHRFGLDGLARRTAGSLSGGQARRLALAIGLVHAPRLLFLDEPTLGLDPRARAALWREIRELRDQGSTVFLTTHYLDEVDNLCDRLAIIDAGRVIVDGTPAELKRSLSADVIQVRMDSAPTAAIRASLGALPSIRSLQSEGVMLRVYADEGERVLPAVLRALDHGTCAVDSITMTKPSLDDVFLRHTGRSLDVSAGTAP